MKKYFYSNKNKFIITFIIVLLLFMCGCHPKYGFVESEFRLSPDSRLPKWVGIPPGLSRDDLSMTITFYTHPFLKKVKIVVIGPKPENKVINEVIGDQWYHPLTLNQPRDVFPRYIVVSVDNIKEVFEHKEKGPVFFITDDHQIISELKMKP